MCCFKTISTNTSSQTENGLIPYFDYPGPDVVDNEPLCGLIQSVQLTFYSLKLES